MNFSSLFSRYQTHFNLFSLNRSMILTNTSTRKSAVNTWEHILLQPPRSLWKQNHDRLLWLLWEQKCLLLYHEVFYPVWHLNERKNKLNEEGLKLPFWGTGTKISSKTRLTVHRSCLLSLIVYVFIILDYFIFLWRGSVKQNATDCICNTLKLIFWTDRAVGALADLPLSLCDIVDLALVPVSGPLHHFQARQQRVLLLLQLFHLLQLCELTVRKEGWKEEKGKRKMRLRTAQNETKKTCLKSLCAQISHKDPMERKHLTFIFPMPSLRELPDCCQD